MSFSTDKVNSTAPGNPFEDSNIRILLYVLVSTVGGILIVWCCLCLGTIIVGTILYNRQKKNDTQKALLRLESKSPRLSDRIKVPNSIDESEASKEDK